MVSQAIAPQGAKRPFVMRKGISRLDDLVDGVAMANVALAGAKTIFYADGNYGSDGQSGVGGWDNAVKTLTVAIARSHADIASGDEGYAARNVILCKADAFEEDIDLLPQKTDIIGVGHHDRYSTGLVGNHTPLNTCYGTRFFNFHFMGDSSGGDMWILDDEAAGLEFHSCFFDSSSTTAALAAIVATSGEDLVVSGCRFQGAFSDAVIEIASGDTSRGLRIVDNFIEGANQGIHINSSCNDESGGNQRSILIQGNTFRTVTECVYDESSIAMIINNRGITAQADGDIGEGAFSGNVNLSCNNFASTSGEGVNTNWPEVVSFGS